MELRPGAGARLSEGRSRGFRADQTHSRRLDQAGAPIVLDTSVLLADPLALLRFDEHEVVLPVVVITELEAKRHHPELGYFARQALRLLDDLRVQHGRLDAPIPVGEIGGTLRVELNHSDPSGPARRASGWATTTRASSRSRATSPPRGTTSPSCPRTCRCGSRRPRSGLVAEEYRAELAVESGWTGMAELEVGAASVVDALYDERVASTSPEARDLPVPHRPGAAVPSAAARSAASPPDKQVRLVRGDREAFGLHGRSAEQRIALDLLLDPDVGIVSLGGRAGTGKSALALCAGLEAVLERRQHRKVMVFRPLYAVGGQELGYLPGTEAEKMSPWAQAVFDTLGALVSPARSSRRSWTAACSRSCRSPTSAAARCTTRSSIVDEAQSLERNVLLTVLSRIGQSSRVVLTHDVAQRDNLRVGRHDGVAAVIEALKGHPLFAHVTLTRSERSPIAALVTEMLEEPVS